MTAFYSPQDFRPGHAPVLDGRSPRRRSLYRGLGKRSLDIVLVLVSLPVTLPVIALLALAVALGGGNPFYTQTRVGKGGRLFRMWKLRSMVPDAERRLAELLASDAGLRAEWERNQKLRRDPRITWVGRFLRKSSLDELPQILNVLTGEMSLVGPRPMLPDQQVLYPGGAYYDVRPGLTGLWQVVERNDSDFARRAHFDTHYVARLSLGSDVRIILRTFSVVARGTGC